MNGLRRARLLTLSFAVISVSAGAALAACGSSSSGGGNPTEASAVSPITIGLSVAQTGAEAIPSLATGYREAVSEANAAGGIEVGGTHRQIRLMVLDNRSDPSLLAQQVHTLVLQDKAVALVSGCCDLNVTEAPLANALKVPLVGTAIPTDLMAKVNGTYSWDAFVSLSSGADYFAKVLPSLGKTNGKVAIIGNNNPQGEAFEAGYIALAKASHYQITTTALVPVGTTDFSSVISNAKATEADNLVVQMTTPDCFALWKQMKAQGYQPKTVQANQCGAIPTWAELGTLGNGATIGMNWTPTSGLPEATRLASVFNRTYPNDVADQATAVNSYDAMEILLSAIKRANSTDPTKINDALPQTRGAFPLGMVKFDSHHNWNGTTFFAQWQNGRVVQVYPPVAGVHAEFPVGGLAG
jgi:ABC-type branched-subunit amino acid transport system substrate-binding protein